jgi:hypothetical protein
MRKFVSLLAFIVLMSCNHDYNHKQMWEQSTVILDKNILNGVRGPDKYQFYMYNGQTTQWYEVSRTLYDKYEPGDSLHCVVLQLVTSKCDSIP